MIALTGFENLVLTSGAPTYVLSMLADRISFAWETTLGAERGTPLPEFGMHTLGDQFVNLIEGRNGLRAALHSLTIVTEKGTRDLTEEEEHLVEESLHEFDSILGEIQTLAAKYAVLPSLSSSPKATEAAHEEWLSKDIFAKDVAGLLGSAGFMGVGRHNGMRTFTSFLAWRRAKEFLTLSPKEGRNMHGLTSAQIKSVQEYLRSGVSAYNLNLDGKTLDAIFREISSNKARVLSEE